MTPEWLVRRLSVGALALFIFLVIQDYALFSIWTGPTRHGYWEEFTYKRLALVGFEDRDVAPFNFVLEGATSSASLVLVSAAVFGMGVAIVTACLLGLIKPGSWWLYPLSAIVLLWFAAGGSLAYRLLQRYVVDMSKGRPYDLETQIGTYLIAWCVSLIVVAGAASRLHPRLEATR